MSEMNCRVEIPEIKGLEKDDLTVGREFFVVCEGPWPKFNHPENIKLSIDEKQKYSLQLRTFEMRDANTAQLKVVSYNVGPNKFEKLNLSDGEQKIDLGPFEFQLRTVIEKKSEEKIEPYGPIGPLRMGIPLLYWVILIILILTVGLSIFARIRRRIQRQRMLEKMREHDSALSPLQDFHQKLRRLQRENVFFHGGVSSVAELIQVQSVIDQMLRIYLIRKFQVPALDWKDSLILKDLKRFHFSVYEDCSADLKKILTEFAKAKKASELKAQDLIQISEQARRMVEKLDRVAENTESKRGRSL